MRNSEVVSTPPQPDLYGFILKSWCECVVGLCLILMRDASPLYPAGLCTYTCFVFSSLLSNCNILGLIRRLSNLDCLNADTLEKIPSYVAGCRT